MVQNQVLVCKGKERMSISTEHLISAELESFKYWNKPMKVRCGE
jgi:hypothetical protein